MIFEDFAAFLDMGGYGLFVWSAYGFALLVFAYNIIQPIRMRRKIITLNRQRMTQ